MKRFTLVNRYGGTQGVWYDYDVAENVRLSIDDWWLWTVVDMDYEL